MVVVARRGTVWAILALAIGLPHCAFSVYWALGGTALIDTVGSALADRARGGDGLVLAIAWVAAAFKLAAAVLPLIAVRVQPRAGGHLIRMLAWAEGFILTLYGGVLTAVGLLVQLNVIEESADADHRALAWHAFFWDPWFMLWGVCVIVALVLSRQRPAAGRSRHGSGTAALPRVSDVTTPRS